LPNEKGDGFCATISFFVARYPGLNTLFAGNQADLLPGHLSLEPPPGS
jgi:hypothetical protein